MPRATAQLSTSIWNVGDFRALSGNDQWLYLALLTAPDLDSAGVLPWLPRRIANRSCDMTADQVDAAARALGSAGFVVIDPDAQEAFVSGFFAAARIARQPKRVVAAVDAIAELQSTAVRAAASAELGDELAGSRSPAPRGVRLAVLERDGWRCVRCQWAPGDPVPAKGARPLYRALEIDHIVPRARGGTDHPGNYQVLCTSCNASKGATI